MKLAHYSSLSIAFLAGGQAADAQIEYHNLDPDAVRDLGNTFFVTYQPLIYLDIDDDGSDDLQLDIYFGLGTTFTNQDRVEIQALNANWSILLTNDDSFPRALKYGNNIDGGGIWDTFQGLTYAFNNETNIAFATFYGENCDTLNLPTEYNGNFYNETGRFVGLRFHDGADYYYGWLRLSTDFHAMCPEPLNDAVTLWVHDYAWNTIPNDPLFAGETGLDCNAPFPLAPVAISPVAETVKWQPVVGAAKYRIKYRQVGMPSWTNVLADAPKSSKKLTGLICNTDYEWKIAASCDGGATFSAFSDTQHFSTTTCRMESAEDSDADIAVYPNPASEYILINLDEFEEQISIDVHDATGNKVLSAAPAKNDVVKMDISSLPHGLYVLTIKGNTMSHTVKIMKI